MHCVWYVRCAIRTLPLRTLRRMVNFCRRFYYDADLRTRDPALYFFQVKRRIASFAAVMQRLYRALKFLPYLYTFTMLHTSKKTTLYAAKSLRWKLLVYGRFHLIGIKICSRSSTTCHFCARRAFLLPVVWGPAHCWWLHIALIQFSGIAGIPCHNTYPNSFVMSCLVLGDIWRWPERAQGWFRSLQTILHWVIDNIFENFVLFVFAFCLCFNSENPHKSQKEGRLRAPGRIRYINLICKDRIKPEKEIHLRYT